MLDESPRKLEKNVCLSFFFLPLYFYKRMRILYRCLHIKMHYRGWINFSSILNIGWTNHYTEPKHYIFIKSKLLYY